MEALLNQIRGVVGVTGVMVVDRNTGRTGQLVPASYDEDCITELKVKFTDLLEKVDDSAFVRVKLRNGWAIVKVNGNFACLVLARDELNVSTLNLVLKSITIAQDQGYSGVDSQEEIQPGFNKNSTEALLKAINLIKEYFTDSLSRFKIAQILRDTKSELYSTYPDLKNFTVDPNGVVDLIKGSASTLDYSIVEGVANWIISFKNRVRNETVVAAFDVKEITSDIRLELESLKFYQSFRKAYTQG